jgi:hypothetical protein
VNTLRSMSGSGTPPVGWYPDPSGAGARWWTGTAWSADTSPQASPGPPGWLPDPHDKTVERWWDGLRWTGATKPAEVTPAAAPRGPAAAPAAPAPPAGRRSTARRLRDLDQKVVGRGDKGQDLSGQPWRLQRRFQKLGSVQGLTLADIIKATGRPSSISALPNGQLVQWQAIASTGGYHLAAEFDAEGRCTGITHESSS